MQNDETRILGGVLICYGIVRGAEDPAGGTMDSRKTKKNRVILEVLENICIFVPNSIYYGILRQRNRQKC